MPGGSGGVFRQMAWIPRPEGEVSVYGAREEMVGGERSLVGGTVGVNSVRRERLVGGRVVSRLPGLASRLGGGG